jgi:hypothetical protein
MIPNPDKVKEIQAVLELQQSEVVKNRIKKKTEFIAPMRKGTCIGCRKPNKNLLRKRWDICYTCFNWCRIYVVEKYGYFHHRHLGEAVAELIKPIPCIFNPICGNTLTRFKEDGGTTPYKRRICPKCKVIWDAGYKAAVYHIRGRIEHRITDYDKQKPI